jgi:hypothetical protein
MEQWNGGMMSLRNKEESFFFIPQYSNIPLFQHYTIIRRGI